MAYVNVADWKPDQVIEWLKGLDGIVVPYIHAFLKQNINGQQLLDMQSDNLQQLGVTKLGHQEIILEAIELLRNFHYELDRENLQLLALRLSCLAHSLHNELWSNHVNDNVVSTQVLADVANLVTAVKPLVCWLDRAPFSGQDSYIDKKSDLLKLSLEMATSGQRERFAEKPVENIRRSCKQLATLADSVIQDVDDSLLLQPALLDLATLKKRPGDQLGFYIVPSFHGIHQVGELKCNSAAHQSGKIETGDEIVQINYQTVVGWQLKEVMALFEESETEVVLTLKKRPRHSKIFGQIYIKPYRLPCKRQIGYSTRWHDLITPARSELLTVPHFILPLRIPSTKLTNNIAEVPKLDKPPPSPTPSTASTSSSNSSESELIVPSSPNSVRLYLPKPRMPVQRRATITGASPVSKNAPLSLEQFWHELKLEREWRSNSGEKPSGGKAHSETQLRSSSIVGNSSLSWSSRLTDHKIPNEPVSLPSSCHRIPEAVEIVSPVEEKSDLKLASTATATVDGIIPLKERIASLNKAAESVPLTPKKPKLLPKPVLDNASLSNGDSTKPHVPARIKPITPIKIPLQFVPKDPNLSPRRERGKLDKSYSTPSYDYSTDVKDERSLFSIKSNVEKELCTVDQKSKSDQDHSNNVSLKTTDIASVDNAYLEIKPERDSYIETRASDKKSDDAYLEIKVPEDNGYLEIKSDDVTVILSPEDDNSKMISRKVDCGVKCDAKEVLGSSSTVKNISSPPLSMETTTPVGKNVSSESDLCTLKDGKTVLLNTVNECTASEPLLTDSMKKKILPPPRILPHENDSKTAGKFNMSLDIDSTINHSSNTSDAPSTFPRCKIDVEKSILLTPPAPEPPPRPAKANSSTMQNKSNSNKNSFTKSKAVNHKSPKSFRKKNPLLAKRRNVSVKDLGVCDHEGWLYHRLRKAGRGSPQWIKGWFIIKGTLFYGFNSKESMRARLMISLPGFTASPAEEVKSRHYAFKVYHTGTTFYFAAECGEDLGGWVESFGRVTVSEEEQSVVMSETDGEDDDESKKSDKSNETNNTHTPTMKKLSGLFSGHLIHDTTKSDKKFNSLKKTLIRKSAKDDNMESAHHVASASLDRKYLKFLGGSTKQSIVPVPTAQFRSYRRVAPGNVTEAISTTLENSQPDASHAAPVPSTSPTTRPPDMADYRLASLAKANNNSGANNQRTPQDTNPTGYMTLETFMMSRQEEERRHQLQQEQQQIQNPRSATLRVPQCHAPPPPTQHIPSHSVTAFTAVTGHEEDLNLFTLMRSPVTSDCLNRSDQPIENKNGGGSSEKTQPINSLRLKPISSTSSSSTTNIDNHNIVKGLKKTAQYQPPPWESANSGEESRLHPAFEMTLDHNADFSATNKCRNNKADESFGGTKFKNLFGNSKTAESSHKSILSSPRFRRVFFKDKRMQNSASCREGGSSGSVVVVQENLMQKQATDDCQNAPPYNKSTSGSSGHIKSGSSGGTTAADAPEYPGLEYPPVFEPGTYSLSDVSTILRSKSLRNCHTNILYSGTPDANANIININGDCVNNSDGATSSGNSQCNKSDNNIAASVNDNHSVYGTDNISNNLITVKRLPPPLFNVPNDRNNVDQTFNDGHENR